MSADLDLDAFERALAGRAAASNPPASAEQRQALADARRGARKAKRPAIVQRAVMAVDGGRDLEGARLGLRAVKAHPEYIESHLAAAVALDRLGFVPEALGFYEQALALSPGDPNICALLGATAQRCRKLDLAEKFYRLAMRLQPQSLAHVNNLAGVLRDLGRFSDAIELLRTALYVAPEAAALWNTLGAVLQEQGDPQTAITFLSEAIRLDPNTARGHHNLAIALADLGRFREAGEALERALEQATLPADRAEIISARAYARLGEGRLEEGWADYEGRFDRALREPFAILANAPRWNPEESLAGKHLMIVGEQGLGDEVLFMTTARAALDRAAAVTIACDRRLRPLMARSFPEARVASHATAFKNGCTLRAVADEHWRGVDVWTPMGALPGAFRRTLADFETVRPYLRPDPARVAEMRAQLAGAPGLKVGVAWKSLVMNAKRSRYFAPFAAWAPVLRTPGAAFYSLQYGDTEEETAFAAAQWGVKLHAIAGLDVKDDLDGLAAASGALDLVIGPLNASTNIAAASGCAVWIVERQPDWTALGAPAGLPWYPQARVFRPEAGGEWREIFRVMASELRGLAARAA